MSIYYILKAFLGSIIRKSNIRKTDVWKGFHLYFSVAEKSDKKRLINVLLDLEFLSWHFRCFPDTYFRFGMFMKSFGSKKKMKSFLPQIAYAKNVLIGGGNSKYNLLIDDKIIFHDLMTYYGLPVPQRYFIYRNEEFRNGNILLNDNEVDKIINSIIDDRIFVKRFTGGAASGVTIFKRNLKGYFEDLSGQEVSAIWIRQNFGKESYIFEKQVKQEPELSSFNPDTVNTIRVLTFGKEVISATIRFGGKGSYVDNTAKGGVAVNLDVCTGKLGEFGLHEYDLTKLYSHPDSGIEFKNKVCHQWPEIKKLVERTLEFLPYYTSVGFDIATTEKGPLIIEINTGAGIYLSQMGKEIGLADKFLS